MFLDQELDILFLKISIQEDRHMIGEVLIEYQWWTKLITIILDLLIVVVDLILFHQMVEEIVIQDLVFNHHNQIEIKEVLEIIMVPLQHQILLFLEVVVILVVEEEVHLVEEEVHLVEEEAQVEVEVLYQEEVAVDLQEEKTTNISLV